jgi:hypothetical protein
MKKCPSCAEEQPFSAGVLGRRSPRRPRQSVLRRRATLLSRCAGAKISSPSQAEGSGIVAKIHELRLSAEKSSGDT